MSTHSQRGKVKSMRSRGQRLPMPASGYYKPSQSSWGQDEDWKIFSNRELTYMLCRHFLGNIGEVTLSDGDKVIGVVNAISPSCDFGLTYAYGPDNRKNGRIDWTDRVVSNFKIIRVANVKLTDCLSSEVKLDGDAMDPEVGTNCSERELVPYFKTSDTLKDITLDQGGFPAEEMFKTNKELFSLQSTYNPDLREYTVPLDKLAPNYSEMEAICAKLAEDFERSQPKSSSEGEDDEQKYSAVARVRDKDCVKPIKTSHNVSDKLGVCVRGSDSVSVDKPTYTSNVEGSKIGTEDQPAKWQAAIDSVPKDSALKRVIAKSHETVDLPDNSSVNGKSEPVNGKPDVEKPKKSTLDPNAPEFQPMCLQVANHSTSAAAPSCSGPLMSNTSPYFTLVNTNVPGIVPSTNLVPIQQAGVISSSVPYAFQGNHLPHLMQNSVASPPPNNLQQTRGGSLPPVQQPAFTTFNAGANLLLQHTQMLNQPLIVTTGHNRFPNTQSVNLNRQRTNDTLTSVPNSGGYGYPQTMPFPAFQSPAIYQIPQAGNPFPFVLSSHPHFGLHLVPTGVPAPVTSSGLVVSSLPMTQSSGQQNYSTQSILQMQPHLQLTNPSHEHIPQHAHQQPQTQLQIFPHALNEHASLTLPPCNPNPMFAQQPARSYYPHMPPVVDGHTSVNTSMMAGLLPVMNQCNVPHSLAGPHQTQVDSTLVGAQSHQYQQANCQPPSIMQCFPAPNTSYTNVQAAHHINALHAAFAAYGAGAGNSASQNH